MRSASACQAGTSSEGAGHAFAGRESGVLDHGPGAGEAAQVAGLGEDRGGADRGDALDGAGQLGQFEVVENELTRRGKIRPCLRIVRKLDAALADPAGVIAHRPGAFERIGWLIEDWDTARTKLADTEARMVSLRTSQVLDLQAAVCVASGPDPPGSSRCVFERPTT